MAANPPWLGAVIGAALRQIRLEQGLTQEEIARLMRVSSVPWNQDTVGLLEKGRRRLLEIGELAALTALLGDLNIKGDRLCPDGSGQVRVGGGLSLSRAQIGELLRTLPGSRDGLKVVPGGLDSNALQDVPGVELRGRPFPSDAELRAAKRLSKRLGREVTGVEVYWACGKLSSSLPGLDEWRERRLAEQLGLLDRATGGHSPDALRRAPLDQVQALRGHITRTLLRELEEDFRAGPAHADSP